MAYTTYSFGAYNSNYSYDKWDVIQGVNSSTDTRFFYSTVGSNMGNYPLSRFIYTATQTTRMSDEVMRVSFTQTGTATFKQGSVVVVQGVVPDATANYTGVALAGGSGYVDFLCPGLTTSNAATNGNVIAPIHPNWTTGFMWTPSFSSKLNNKQVVIESQLGEGYRQAMNPFINSNSFEWELTFENRTNKEARSLMNFLQDKCGVIPFVLAFPVGNLSNRNNLQYVNGDSSNDMSSYNINTVSVNVKQVFDL